ncbi:hypothetical protein [Caldiplasma sukawensis]
MTKKSKKQSTWRNMTASFHLRLKHILGDVSLLSLLAAFEVFSIPAASGLIDIFWIYEINCRGYIDRRCPIQWW